LDSDSYYVCPPQFLGVPFVTADGSVLVMSTDGHCYSISAQGVLNWRVKVDENVSAPNSNGDNEAIAYFVAFGGLKAINADGKILWTAEGSFSTIPIISKNGRIYVAQMHIASAYERDGTLAWRSSIRGVPGAYPALTLGGAVCITTDWGFVHILL
jgi:outer membrane protein assembly factor BamB